MLGRGIPQHRTMVAYQLFECGSVPGDGSMIAIELLYGYPKRAFYRNSATLESHKTHSTLPKDRLKNPVNIL